MLGHSPFRPCQSILGCVFGPHPDNSHGGSLEPATRRGSHRSSSVAAGLLEMTFRCDAALVCGTLLGFLGNGLNGPDVDSTRDFHQS